MWDIGGDEWDPLEGIGILEIGTLSLDEPVIEAILFQWRWTRKWWDWNC